MNRRLGVGLLLALLAGFPFNVAAMSDLRVQAARSGSGVMVSVQACIKASHAVLWATLTDYNRLAEFVPGLTRSRVIGRRGPVTIVEQDGEATLLFFKYPIHVVVESAEAPPGTITINVVRGNLKQLEGRYEVEQGALPDEYILRWTGIIEPSTLLPAFISVPLIRGNVEEQFVGMVKEIERRTAGRYSRDGQVSEK